jgi:lipoate-protein ligase A
MTINCICINTGVNDGYYNMAADEVFMDMVSKKESMPILRFYTWNPPAISLGYFQKVRDSIDLDFCRRNNIDVVRRITGGRTVLHQKELTYSIILPEDCEFAKGGITETYKKISIGILEGLKLCGINAEFSPGIVNRTVSSACFEASSRYEIVIGSRKLVGSAQTRKKGVLLQHGSIVISFDEQLFAECLGINEEFRTQFINGYKSKTASIELYYGSKISEELLIKNIKMGFVNYANINIIEGAVSDSYKLLIDKTKNKYIDDKWNFLR